jgi:hypothetical protein
MHVAVSTDAVGTKKEVQTPAETDSPPDCAELKCVGTMAEDWEGMLMSDSKKWMSQTVMHDIR